MIHTPSKNKGRSSFTVFLWLIRFFWDKGPKIRYGILFSLLCEFFFRLYSAALPMLFKYIIDNLSMETIQDPFFVQALLLISGIAWTVNKVGQELVSISSAYGLAHGLRLLNMKIFHHLHSLSLRVHIERKTGSLLKAIDRTESAIDSLFWRLFLFIIPTVIEMVIIIAVFTKLYGMEYGGILFCTTLIFFLFSYYGIQKLDALQKSYNANNARANAAFVDSLLNVETVKYFHNQNYDERNFDTILQEKEKINVKLHLFACFFAAGQKVIIGIGFIFLIWKAGTAVLHGFLTVGDFVLINSYIVQFTSPLSTFGYYLCKIKASLVDIGEMVDLLHTESEIKDKSNALDIQGETATVTFSRVKFGYDPDREILHNISFTIPQGKMVAIVGPTGSGKSTVAKLLFRLYDVNSGAIFFNDHDIRDITQQSLHQAIGVVSQETNLFNKSLYYNIAYARPSATKAEVEQAIKDAHLTDFIARLPEGYDTVVGERGLKLSGGEKQRIAIARVLLKNPPLYIFDEATSSLDTNTERVIHHNLREIAHGKTSLIIAHRLSTIVHADEIIVLDKGVIVEQGNHEQLLKRKGVYHDLWQSQETSS
jgi:ATP-binding cassette, subfamily B, heavy metal transporter